MTDVHGTRDVKETQEGKESDAEILATYRAVLEVDGVDLAMRAALQEAHLTPTQALRKLVVERGIPDEDPWAVVRDGQRATTRGLVWKALLGVRTVAADEYIALVRAGPASCAKKISCDVGRTFQSDKDFCSLVSSDSLTRLLNAFANDVDGLFIAFCCCSVHHSVLLFIILFFGIFTQKQTHQHQHQHQHYNNNNININININAKQQQLENLTEKAMYKD